MATIQELTTNTQALTQAVASLEQRIAAQPPAVATQADIDSLNTAVVDATTQVNSIDPAVPSTQS